MKQKFTRRVGRAIVLVSRVLRDRRALYGSPAVLRSPYHQPLGRLSDTAFPILWSSLAPHLMDAASFAVRPFTFSNKDTGHA